MYPELILHTKDTDHLNSIDLMFKCHICSSCLADTSRGVQGGGRTKEISKLYVKAWPVTLNVGKGTFDLHNFDWPM